MFQSSLNIECPKLQQITILINKKFQNHFLKLNEAFLRFRKKV